MLTMFFYRRTRLGRLLSTWRPPCPLLSVGLPWRRRARRASRLTRCTQKAWTSLSKCHIILPSSFVLLPSSPLLLESIQMQQEDDLIKESLKKVTAPGSSLGPDMKVVSQLKCQNGGTWFGSVLLPGGLWCQADCGARPFRERRVFPVWLSYQMCWQLQVSSLLYLCLSRGLSEDMSLRGFQQVDRPEKRHGFACFAEWPELLL